MKTPSNSRVDVDPKQIKRIVEEYPIDVAVLYGSTVRGDETAESDVDVAVLDAIRPEVGASALETGIIIVGGNERVDAIRERFERERETDETHEDRMRRFDSILERLEGRV